LTNIKSSLGNEVFSAAMRALGQGESEKTIEVIPRSVVMWKAEAVTITASYHLSCQSELVLVADHLIHP
jgi:hypothetical protein